MEKDQNTQSSPEGENVISLFARAIDKKPIIKTEEQVNEDSFEQVRQKNHEVSERLRKERAKANRAVLRSYRIKT